MAGKTLGDRVLEGVVKKGMLFRHQDLGAYNVPEMGLTNEGVVWINPMFRGKYVHGQRVPFSEYKDDLEVEA